MSSPLPDYMTAAEAAKVLRVEAVEAARLCRAGALKAYKPGKAWLIDPKDLDDYVKRASERRLADEQAAS